MKYFRCLTSSNRVLSRKIYRLVRQVQLMSVLDYMNALVKKIQRISLFGEKNQSCIHINTIANYIADI